MLLRETSRVPLLFQGWVLRTKDLMAPLLIRFYTSARLQPAYWLASRILSHSLALGFDEIINKFDETIGHL